MITSKGEPIFAHVNMHGFRWKFMAPSLSRAQNSVMKIAERSSLKILPSPNTSQYCMSQITNEKGFNISRSLEIFSLHHNCMCCAYQNPFFCINGNFRLSSHISQWLLVEHNCFDSLGHGSVFLNHWDWVTHICINMHQLTNHHWFR